MKKAIAVFDQNLYNGFTGGAIEDKDFAIIKKGINSVRPTSFIETGAGRSTELIFEFLCKEYPLCMFYTIDPIYRFLEKAEKRFGEHNKFHAVLGLSVRTKDLVSPAAEEHKNYPGPENVLVGLLESKFKKKKVDMVFIDSREGSAVAEFKAIEKYLSAKAMVLCHDVLNGGTGYELQEYLKGKQYKCFVEQSPVGILRVERLCKPRED